jgi:hypothetical protein
MPLREERVRRTGLGELDLQNGLKETDLFFKVAMT